MGSARLRGCTVLRENQLTEGVARLRGCTDARFFGKIYCVIVICMYM